jgi:leucyl-tRNA synthetase
MSSERRYDPKSVEPKWQALWERERTWEVSNDDAGGDPFYVLEMLPYPSGDPHMGHLKNYAVGDAVAHFQRRVGRRVLHPIGYDAFGLPAENNAIKSGQHPRESTAQSIAAFHREFHSWGVSFDWSRELASNEPSYYRWTQWIFLKLYERGLAYRAEAAVNWCPSTPPCSPTSRSSTAAASAAARRSRRASSSSGSSASPTTPTACSTTSRPSSGPRTWSPCSATGSGAPEGAEVQFSAPEMGVDYPVFTTRPDTLFGATFFVMAPEHPDVLRLAEGTEHEEEVRAYVNHALTESHEDRGDAEREKTGVPLGRSVVNPVNGERIPMWVADYVLMEYGTGAIMAVPGHDARDHEFAEKFGLPIKRVIEGGDGELPYMGDGALVNSDPALRRAAEPRGAGGDRRLARRPGPRPPLDQLPPARLAAVPPALLGLPDPDHPLP